ncbi:hypothetical protein KL937_005155 [Ogataea polymorpha]|nr:hypothetical protein KL937_005155 [Ogataea polymorpha]KAG7931279.1 hypothetical protein KL904_005154 [Ogataea polymorpha]
MSRPPIPATVQAPFPLVIRNTSVVAGFGRGSAEMGIPTANVPVDNEPELQKLVTGVYFGFVRLLRPEQPPQKKIVSRSDGKSEVEFTYGANLADSDFEVLPMVMSLGWNPFFKNSKKACELHILHEFKSTFYGCKLNFIILGYVRPELDYVSMEALIKDIQLDIETARKYLATPEYANAGHDAVDQKAQPEVLQMTQRHRRVPHKIARGQCAVHFRVRRGRKNTVLVEVFVVEERDCQHYNQRRLDKGHNPHAEVELVGFFRDQRPHSGQQTKQPTHQIQPVVEKHAQHQHIQDLEQFAARAVGHNGVQKRDPDGDRGAVLAGCPKFRNEIHGKVFPCDTNLRKWKIKLNGGILFI